MDGKAEIIEDVLSRVDDCENSMSEFYGRWNEWTASYEVKYIESDKRPSGVSKNIVGETTRAVNALASAITRMQTTLDPFFELRADEATEEQLFYLEKKYKRQLIRSEFKRNLMKGNRGMCLFGTQVWEEPYVTYPAGVSSPLWQGTDFRPISLLQARFDPTVYDINHSDFFGTMNRVSSHYLRNLANSGNAIWDLGEIEDGIKGKSSDNGGGTAESSIDTRRQRAGYNRETEQKNHSLLLFHGKLKNMNNPFLLEMWAKSGRTDDIRFSDITIGILDRKRLVRIHPTPYGTWHHMYKIGHYIEFELEPLAYGVGSLGQNHQKDMNRMVRYMNDVAKFSLWNMFLAGRGSGLKSTNMNVFPWAAIQVDDISQIKELRPQIEGIVSGLKLNEAQREDFRGMTHATSSLQALATGGTATEVSLLESEAKRAVSIIAEIGADSYIRPHLETMHINERDQNPYDAKMYVNVEFFTKVATDKDSSPEMIKNLLQILTVSTSVRQNMPLDFNPQPVLDYLVRQAGINPQEFKTPRPQVDKLLDVLKRTNSNGDLKNEMMGHVADVGNGGGLAEPPGAIPNSPLQGGLNVA